MVIGLSIIQYFEAQAMRRILTRLNPKSERGGEGNERFSDH
jgi:hypothetical protein